MIYLCSLSKRRGKQLWVNSNFFILKLWELARLFATMACVNLVIPPQKLNWNETLQRDTRGFNAPFFSLNSFSFCCAIYSTNVHIARTWKDSQRAYICCRTKNFACSFTTNNLFEKIQTLNEWKFHRLVQL